MLLHSNGSTNGGKQVCSVLDVVCKDKKLSEGETEDRKRYPFPKLASSSLLEVRTLSNPSLEEFWRTLELVRPNVVYLQGEVLSSDEVGGLCWDGVDLSNDDAVSELFGNVLHTVVYLEIPNGEQLANSIYSKGIPYVIYWHNDFSCYAASHFQHALFSVLQSSPCHTLDAFQLAHASFRLYCIRNNLVLPKTSHKSGDNLGPSLLGEAPNVDAILPVADDDGEEEEEGSVTNLSAVKIHDDDVSVRFLICGEACSTSLDEYLLESLEDGLNAILSIEMRASKLQNRFSAPPPPLQAGTFSRGVITMRCDISTCSSAHVSLLVSGSAQTCFDDQQLENHIKKEAIEIVKLVQAIPSSEENKIPSSDPRTSVSIACAATVFEVCLKAPSWVLQVLRQLALETSHRSLVALGIASIQGLPVASFDKDDANRLLFFSSKQNIHEQILNNDVASLPSWLKPPPPKRKYSKPLNGPYNSISPARQKLKVAAMRPIPQTNLRNIIPFSELVQADSYDMKQVKSSFVGAPPMKHNALASNPAANRKSSNTFQAKQIISLNPIPLKKHNCSRASIQLCSEDDFLMDVMQFLIHRGHNRLIP